MNIDEILCIQSDLQRRMGNPMDGGTGNVNTGVRENMLAMIVEAVEVLNEVNWKPWKPPTKVIDRERIVSELIDVLQFWANAVNAVGLTEDDLIEAYRAKLAICYRRIDQGETTNAKAK